MIVIPAVDIKNGKCVRLLQGKKDQETIYSEDPVEMAKKWEEEGAEYLHVVDLDGAFTGTLKNISVILQIVKELAIPVQVGGGIRTLGTIEELLSHNVHRVILGTVALHKPDLVEQAVKNHGSEKIMIGIDAKNGMVAVKGWIEESEISAIELGKQMFDYGVKKFVYTDISKDGMLLGPNYEEISEFAREIKAEIIASGGISSLQDIQALAKLEIAGVVGMITGKALYENKFKLGEALTAVNIH